MNFKFLLTVALSFGCIFMLFMWYSAKSLFKESQLYEKQFLFKISTLESENKMELKLIEGLRADISKNEQDLKFKSNLIESLRHKEKNLEGERENLLLEIESVKKQYDIVNKENNQWLDNWKLISQNQSQSEKANIKQLENKIEGLKSDYESLKHTPIKKPAIVDSSNSVKNSAETDTDKTQEKEQKDKKGQFKTDVKNITVKFSGKRNSEEIDDRKIETIAVGRIMTEKRTLGGENTTVKNEKTKNLQANQADKNDHQMQAKPPVFNKNKIEQGVVKDQLNKEFKPNNNEGKEKKEPENESKLKKEVEVNKNEQQMQARPPVIKKDKSFKSKKENDKIVDQVQPNNNVKFRKHKKQDSDIIKNKENIDLMKISDSEEQIAKHDIKENDKEIKIDDGKKEKEEINDQIVNPKIIKKDDNPQVRPPLPRKILDNMKKNLNDNDYSNDKQNFGNFDKQSLDADNNDLDKKPIQNKQHNWKNAKILV